MNYNRNNATTTHVPSFFFIESRIFCNSTTAAKAKFGVVFTLQKFAQYFLNTTIIFIIRYLNVMVYGASLVTLGRSPILFISRGKGYTDPECSVWFVT